MAIRTVEVPNACLVIALRDLLGQPEWGPKQIVQLIIDNDGFPGDLNDTIHEYAPVIRLGTCSVEGDGFQVTFNTPEPVTLWWWDRIVICVRSGETRGHFTCVPAGDIFSQAEEVLDVFIRNEESNASA